MQSFHDGFSAHYTSIKDMWLAGPGGIRMHDFGLTLKVHLGLGLPLKAHVLILARLRARAKTVWPDNCY